MVNLLNLANEIWSDYEADEFGKLALRIWKAHIVCGVLHNAVADEIPGYIRTSNPYTADRGDGSKAVMTALKMAARERTENERDCSRCFSFLLEHMEEFENKTRGDALWFTKDLRLWMSE